MNLGLRERYKTDSLFCLTKIWFTVLVFLPVEDAEKAYEHLLEDENVLNEFITYFDST